MPRNIRRNVDIQSTIKDYIVPIIGWIIVLIIIISFFRWWDDSVQIAQKENQTPTSIAFSSTETEAIIRYPGDSQENANETTPLYKWETIIVKEWSVSLTNPGWSIIALNKIAELKYNEDGSYALYSSDAWLTLEEDTSVSMRYANVAWKSWSVISLTQNEAWSTVYVLLWSAKVSNIAWISTNLVQGQKISISRLNASNEDLDIVSEKSTIDSYFKGSDWFIENNWYLAIQQANKEEDSETLTWTGVTEEVWTWDTGTYISFNRLRDEMNVDSNTFNISWTISDSKVWAITIDNKAVTLNIENKSFAIQELPLTAKINDIVVKIYDTDKNILEKKVYTVYTSAELKQEETPEPEVPAQTPSSETENTGLGASATNYEIDATKFAFTEPSTTNKYTTTGSEITIRWNTTAKGISKVKINWFELSSFNGSTWRYHAFERFDTLEEWTNQYRVDYYGTSGAIVYTDYYTIVKKSTTVTPSPEPVIPQEETLFEE